MAAEPNFNAAYRVNSEVITHYDIAQMQKMLELTGEASQDSYNKAVEFLINARLLDVQIRRFDVEINDSMITSSLQGMSSDGDASALRKRFNDEGIDNSTITTYIRAQISRKSFAQQMGIDVSDDADRRVNYINSIPDQVTPTISVSEIILPIAEYGGVIPTRYQYKVIARRLNQGESFATLAKQFSRSPTAENGGALPDLPREGLNPELQSKLEGLKPGQYSAPIMLDGGILILKLNGYGEVRQTLPRNPKVSYIDIFINGANGVGTSLRKATEVMASVQTCSHAEAVLGQYPNSSKKDNVALSEVPSGVSLTLSRMETGTRAIYERADGTSVIYLCDRQVEVPEEYQEVINTRANNAVIESKLNGLLNDLRASASIIKLD